MIDLKKIGEEIELDYKVICEVGVYSSRECHLKNLIPLAQKAILIEANKKFYNEIEKVFSDYKHVMVYNYAVYKENLKTIKLYNRKASSFIEGIKSPNVVNTGYKPEEKDVFYVEAKTFDFFDEGDIDILTVDIEGAEWYVLDNLISRPKIICLETHSKLYDWQTYINPHINEIREWMRENNYIEYTKDVSDTVYVRK